MRQFARKRRRGTVDATMVQLVRLALDQHRTATTSASALLEAADHDQDVLRRVRAKVFRSSTDRRTPVTDRAIAALDLAIDGHSRP